MSGSGKKFFFSIQQKQQQKKLKNLEYVMKEEYVLSVNLIGFSLN